MRLFYDHLVDKNKLLDLVRKQAPSEKERKKLAATLDEIVHKTVLDVILIHLDQRHHEEFLAMLHKTPHSEKLLVYIKQKGHPDIEKKIGEEVEKLTGKTIRELDPV